MAIKLTNTIVWRTARVKAVQGRIVKIGASAETRDIIRDVTSGLRDRLLQAY